MDTGTEKERRAVVIDEVRAGLQGGEDADEMEMDHSVGAVLAVCAAAVQAQVTNAFLSPPSKFPTHIANNRTTQQLINGTTTVQMESLASA